MALISLEGKKELHEVMKNRKDDGKAKPHLLQKVIKREFNPPAASYMGKTDQNG